MTDESTSIKIPKFSGKQEDWLAWREQFKSVLIQKGMRLLFKACRTDGVEIPKESDDCMVEVTPGGGAKRVDTDKKALKDQNTKAFAHLLTSSM
jgi:hypothetical protein